MIYSLHVSLCPFRTLSRVVQRNGNARKQPEDTSLVMVPVVNQKAKSRRSVKDDDTVEKKASYPANVRSSI
jgi:hypothetical protein